MHNDLTLINFITTFTIKPCVCFLTTTSFKLSRINLQSKKYYQKHEPGCFIKNNAQTNVNLSLQCSFSLHSVLKSYLFSNEKIITLQSNNSQQRQSRVGIYSSYEQNIRDIQLHFLIKQMAVSLEQYMKITTCRLPPLPKKTNVLKQLILQCQSISIQHKQLTVQAQSTNNDQDCQIIKQKLAGKALQVKRPRSNKSQKSVDSRYKSSDSHRRRNYSYEFKKAVTLSQVPPKISAKSWIVYDMQQGRALWTHRSHKRREMASLTKMMNLITILQLTSCLSLDAREIKVRASKSACEITGTTAQLRLGAQYTLYDLYFGMMLPSGNDAAHLIAEIGGYLLKIKREGLGLSLRDINNSINSEIVTCSDQLVTLYLWQTNRLARKLDMISSNFANPHGLSNKNNYSTAQDLAKLCAYSMRNGLFRRIVQTKKHSYTLLLQNDKPEVQTVSSNQSIDQNKENIQSDLSCELPNKQKTFLWENTNRMLGEGWSGIKTGVTPNAGPCLAASLACTLEGKRYQFVLILLSSESMEARWKEVRQLVDWVIRNRKYV